jgi:hypothetical protein
MFDEKFGDRELSDQVERALDEFRGERRPDDELYVYVVKDQSRSKTRFIITQGMFDAVIDGLLKDGEFVDEVNTLSGRLGGEVMLMKSSLK